MSRVTPLTIGYESHNYGAGRNTYSPVEGLHHQKVRRIPFELSGLSRRRGLHRVHLPLGSTRVDVTHLWNRTSLGRGDWGASFESHFPYLDATRHPRLHPFLVSRLVKDNCRFLIAISAYARRSLAVTVGDDVWQEIQHKTDVIFPYQALNIRDIPQPGLGPSDTLRLLFVGVTFFGKGGEAVLRIVERLGDELDLAVTVVSPVAGGDYLGIPPGVNDVANARRRLSDNPRVTWHERLPNSEVLLEMQRHHVGLLPTLADTFGYTVLENMALSVPTIVSNVQALPEFTGVDTGWQIELPLDERGVWIGRGPGLEHRRQSYAHAVDLLDAGLEKAVRAIREQPDLVHDRGASARKRLERQFDPVHRGDAMRQLYERTVR